MIQADVVEVKELAELGTTDRGAGGFGSTGVSAAPTKYSPPKLTSTENIFHSGPQPASKIQKLAAPDSENSCS